MAAKLPLLNPYPKPPLRPPARPTQPSPVPENWGNTTRCTFPLNPPTLPKPSSHHFILTTSLVSDEEYDIGDLVGDCDDCTDGRTSAVINYTQSRYR